MITVKLTKIKTADGLSLEGIIVEPKRKSIYALIWIHGLASRFYSGQDLLRELSSLCLKNNIAYLKFNTRGHDVVNRDDVGRKQLQGGGFENFADSLKDIKAVINLAKKLGYKKIILAGHSTGANKSLYYMYKMRDRAVKALILAGPLNDLAAENSRIGKEKVKEAVRVAEKILKKKKEGIMPAKFGIYSARRYLSLYRRGSAEDVFPYLNAQAKWKELKSVRIPLIVALGEKDQYLDRSAKELTEIFKKNSSVASYFSAIIIKGANHGFKGKEKELSLTLIDKIKEAVKKR